MTAETIPLKIAALTRNGLGPLKPDGFYRNRFPCPKHGGKKNNAALHKHGFIYCHSRCGKVPIPEVNAILGIAPDTPPQEWLETKSEQQDQARLESIARWKFEAEVAHTFKGLPFDMYDAIFDKEVDALMELWRNGVVTVDPPDPLPRARPT